MTDRKQRIAICIPTIHRSAAVEDFLENCAEYYISAGCDLYYFDSNEDDETENVIKKYGNNDHIFYIRTEKNLGLDAANLLILEYIKEFNYDYVWPCTDSIQYSREALHDILKHTNQSYDMITIDFIANRDVYFKEISNCPDYFSYTAYLSTLFGAVLIKSDTILQGADWEYYRKKFFDPKLKAFACIYFYYHRILQLPSFLGAVFSLGKNRYMNSKAKKASIYVRNFIYTWCGQWSDMISDLPSEYEQFKRGAIRQAGSQYFSDTDQFMRMRLDNLYSIEEYEKYKDKWEDVTPVPKEELLRIAAMPIPVVEKHYQESLESGTRKLQVFCQKHPRIIILGAGSIGDAYGAYFDQCGISFDAYCVLHWRLEPKVLHERPVYHIDDILEAEKETGFVIGMGRDDATRALTEIKGKIGDDNIFYNPVFRRDLMFSLGYRKFFAW